MWFGVWIVSLWLFWDFLLAVSTRFSVRWTAQRFAILTAYRHPSEPERLRLRGTYFSVGKTRGMCFPYEISDGGQRAFLVLRFSPMARLIKKRLNETKGIVQSVEKWKALDKVKPRK